MIWQRIKETLKYFLPPTSKTVNGRLDRIEQMSVRGNDMLFFMCKANEIKEIHHDTFLPYKNIYKGRDIVVMGTGPSLNYYIPIENAVHIGVNGAYRYQRVNLDYLFVQDFLGEGGSFHVEELKNLSCQKFVGRYIYMGRTEEGMDASEAVADYIGAKQYFLQYYRRIPLNLEFFPVVDNASTIFAALHFALYTHPKRIYLVGCDCSTAYGEHFCPMPIPKSYIEDLPKYWDCMAEHFKTFFPDIEIVSINPIGLKGYFVDQYTDEFLRDHPELEDK